MARPSPLARYIDDRLIERVETVDDFARRVGINSSGLYKLLRGAYAAPQQRTLAKIAGGLGMSVAELLTAVEAEREMDPIERAIRQRVPEMREAVQGAPRAFWPSIIKSIFDHAIDDLRDTAQIVSAAALAPVSGAEKGGVSATSGDLTRAADGSDGQLPVRKHAARMPAFSY